MCEVIVGSILALSGIQPWLLKLDSSGYFQAGYSCIKPIYSGRRNLYFLLFIFSFFYPALLTASVQGEQAVRLSGL